MRIDIMNVKNNQLQKIRKIYLIKISPNEMKNYVSAQKYTISLKLLF